MSQASSPEPYGQYAKSLERRHCECCNRGVVVEWAFASDRVLFFLRASVLARGVCSSVCDHVSPMRPAGDYFEGWTLKAPAPGKLESSRRAGSKIKSGFKERRGSPSFLPLGVTFASRLLKQHTRRDRVLHMYAGLHYHRGGRRKVAWPTIEASTVQISTGS